MSRPAIPADPEAMLKQHFSLPALPTVVQRLLDALSSGKSSAVEIAALLSVDAGLVAQIMKVVNSAYYGLPTPIREIKHAVAYLGLAEIKRIALTVALMERLAPADSIEFARFWSHSFHTALTARVIARRRDYTVNPEEIYVAALLHDVGKLVYMKFFPAEYQDLTRRCEADASLMVDAENELSLPSHTLFGAVLCDRWLFDDLVKRACLCHELHDLEAFNRGERERHDDLLVICISNVLSNLSTRELSDALRHRIHDEAMKALNCDDRDFLLLMGELYELRSEVGRFLSDF